MAKCASVFIALAFLLAACTASEDEPPSTTPTSQPGSTTTSLIALPDPTAGLGDNTLLACARSGPTFPASALGATISLEEPGYAFVVNAMAPFLSSGEGEFWPQDGWRILHETESEILVVNMGVVQGEFGVSFMTVSLRDGEWRWDGSQAGGPCELTTSPPEGLNRVEWRLDPEFDVDDNFIDLPLLVTEVECVSGQEMGGRLLTPEVIETDQFVLIAFAAVPPEGDSQSCPGNPETPVVVTLAAPLGDRELKDGTKVAGFLSDYIGQDFGLP